MMLIRLSLKVRFLGNRKRQRTDVPDGELAEARENAFAQALEYYRERVKDPSGPCVSRIPNNAKGR